MEDVYSMPRESYDDRKLSNGASKLVQRSIQTPLASPLSKVTPSAIPMSSDKSASSKLKTAKVAAVPKLSRASDSSALKRTDRPKMRLKVSGGTQTETSEPQRVVKSSRSKSPTRNAHAGIHSDSEYQSIGSSEKMFTYHPSVNGDSKLTFKSYSLTSPLANQLSQNVRERLANGSYPKPAYSERSKAPFTCSHCLLLYLFFFPGDKSSGEKFAAHLFAGILEPHKAPEEPAYAEARRNNGFRVDENDAPYTSYWSKYNPKNGNGTVLDLWKHFTSYDTDLSFF